ncbi:MULTISPECIES: hypothetical protein [Providencia]|uniref:hypothetical protein n=1 Tax=Providencia TaxID=586 RepID=UPI001E3D89CF|nr:MULTISPECIES: hypothetical protein [Providencia]MDN7225545.1 hypothetical protein [Providencia stuartii]WAZ78600.1 hypothetical protein O4001_20755 [Providencia stuartii]WAZ84095.1 hypothetical protein O4002_07470 [Providencia stuartii]
MKLTAQSKQIIRDNKLQAFYLDAVSYFEEEHQSALIHYEIKREALFNQLKKNYVYFESIGRASQYLCVTQTTFMLYCGKFYAQSPLFQTVQEHLEQVVLFKDPKSKAWLEGTIEHYQTLDLSHNVSEIIDYAKKRYPVIGNDPSILKSEIELFLLKDMNKQFSDNYKEKDLFLKKALKNINSMPIRKENIIFLCVIAQYLDGLNCFQDELRPKWFGQLQFSGLIPWSFDLIS